MPLHGHEVEVQRLGAGEQQRKPAQHAQYRLGVRHGELSSLRGLSHGLGGKEIGPELRAMNFKRRGWFTPQNRELKLQQAHHNAAKMPKFFCKLLHIPREASNRSPP
ncbi:hypothetical protein V493_02029 [Pseudogymnoascus sp. VKM F-4281 (FW-2241)]|nr:hypothetical protein V493_02029 [Pseudogymnoascus sp. VKM F-4281 (FW-2241)]